MKKICFMFGAGADHDYKFATGNEFKRDILLNNDFSLFKQINNDPLVEKFNNDRLLKWYSYIILYQTIRENENDFDDIVKNENSVYSKFKQYMEGGQNEQSENVLEEFRKYYKNEFYNVIKDGANDDGNYNHFKKSF